MSWSKRSCFRTPLHKQRVYGFKTLLKSEIQHMFLAVILRDWISKTSFLIRCEIVGLFVNTLTAEEKYPRHNKENIQEPSQMKLSKKLKTLFQFFIAFLKLASRFEHYQPQNISISKFMVFKKRIHWNV